MYLLSYFTVVSLYFLALSFYTIVKNVSHIPWQPVLSSEKTEQNWRPLAGCCAPAHVCSETKPAWARHELTARGSWITKKTVWLCDFLLMELYAHLFIHFCLYCLCIWGPLLRLFICVLLSCFFSGRYAFRYAKVAQESLKKQMNALPNSGVSLSQHLYTI